MAFDWTDFHEAMTFDWDDFHRAMTNCPDFEIEDAAEDECCGLACGTCPGCPNLT
jgi:hypothetical protein